MGKPIGRNRKKGAGSKGDDVGGKHARGGEHQHPCPRDFDADDSVFIEMSRDLREEGSKLFQRRDYRGAVTTYEKAVKLLPRGHADIASLRSYLATCYMQMEPADYHHAIEQCNMALEVSPKCSKALLKRAKCYEALDRLEFAAGDVDVVLRWEPNNVTALEFSEKVRKELESRGIKLGDRSAAPVPEPVLVKEREKPRKKKGHKTEDKTVVKMENVADDAREETEKAIVEEERKSESKVECLKVKLVLGEDIRFAQMPRNCSLLQLREIVTNRFPSTSAVLVKYKDREGDLVTITTTEELRWAEESGEPQGSLRLYIAEVSPEQDPLFLSLLENKRKGSDLNLSSNQNRVYENGSVRSSGDKETSCIEDWIVQFAQLFKNHVGFNSDAYLDLHELGMKLYSEAIEDAVTSEDAQEIFDIAEHKFQELGALALFNWGNVHMSRARKRLVLSENASQESTLEKARAAYEWAQQEYIKAGKRYEEAVKMKPDFYEGFLALAQQQFEQAKLSWYYAVGSKTDLNGWPKSEVTELFNKAEENMEKGTQMWEEIEEQRLKDLSKPNKEKLLLEKMGLSDLFKGLSTDEAAEQASNLSSQISLLWGTMLYQRSVIEFKLKLPGWEECLMESVEKFKLAGAKPPDLAVMIKNHCSNETAQEGLGFKIDEIVQAWNEMYDAQRLASGVPSFRLEPLFRRCVPKLHQALEHVAV